MSNFHVWPFPFIALMFAVFDARTFRPISSELSEGFCWLKSDEVLGYN